MYAPQSLFWLERKQCAAPRRGPSWGSKHQCAADIQHWIWRGQFRVHVNIWAPWSRCRLLRGPSESTLMPLHSPPYPLFCDICYWARRRSWLASCECGQELLSVFFFFPKRVYWCRLFPNYCRLFSISILNYFPLCLCVNVQSFSIRRRSFWAFNTDFTVFTDI